MPYDTEYFEQILWIHSDQQVANSSLSISRLYMIDEYRNSPVKLKFSIKQFKIASDNAIYLSHTDVYTILHQLKSKILDINTYIQEINSDDNKQINIQIKLRRNLIFTFLYRIEYGGCCVRIILSNKISDNYLDSEKNYMTILDFLSMLKMLGEFRDSYISISTQIESNVLLNNMLQEMHKFNGNMSGYHKQFISQINKISKSSHGSLDLPSQPQLPKALDIQLDNINEKEEPPLDRDEKESPRCGDVNPSPASLELDGNQIDVSKDEKQSLNHSNVKDSLQIGDIPPLSDNKSKVIDEPGVDLHSKMTDFLEVNRDAYDLKLSTEFNPPADTTQSKAVIDNFTQLFLSNDILNLEMYITNIVNDDLPFTKFLGMIHDKLSFNPFDNISQNTINSIDYLICHYLKFHIKQSLEQQIAWPDNIAPITIPDVKLDEQSISLMCDLFIYFIYYTQVRNMLKEKDHNSINNREFICFCFKTIASPLVISGFPQISEVVLLSEITNRYIKYQSDGVFDNLKRNISDNYSCTFEPTLDSITTEASRIYKAVRVNQDKLTIPETFKKFSVFNLKLAYSDFENNTFTEEQIKKIISLEFNFKKHGKIVYDDLRFDSFDDIPSSIMKKFNVTEVKYDNTNLKRYIRELTSDDKEAQKISLMAVENINYSYRDLKSINVDLTVLSEDVLRSIFVWDIDRDKKITKNYLYYRELVLNCTLTKDMIISMLTNIQDTIDVDFVNAFFVARN